MTLPTPTRTGYELQGWYTTAGTKAGDGGDTYDPTADITLYAKWYEECAGGSSTDVYNGENVDKGNTTASGWTINSSSDMTLTSGSSNGYSYWYLAGSSTRYVQFDGSASLASGDQIIIQWTHTSANKDLALTINGSSASLTSGGHVSTANTLMEAVYDVTSTLSLSSIKLNSSGSSGCIIYQVSIVTAGGGTCYHVTYDGNGATSGFVNDTTAYKSGDEVTVLGNDGRYPYVLGLGIVKGWADTKAKAEAGTVDYAPGAMFTITADKTLYAVWSYEYPITYHLNGASWAGGYSARESYEYADEVTLPEATDMSNPGYTFRGWYANSDLSTGGVVTTIGATEYGAKEFWAKWTENTYTVTYNANGGSGSMETTVGRYVYLRENTFTYAGHIFMGWNTEADGSGVSYNDEDEVKLTADMTLYAQWGVSLDATWSVTKVDGKLYRGGGGYSVTVYLNQEDWDASGDVNDLELTAMEGVVLSNITKTVNGEGKAQVTANFAITTGVAADATEITFTLSVPAAGSYASADLPHEEDLSSCAGSSTVWDFTTNAFLKGGTWSTSAGAENKAYATDGTTILKYYAGGGGDLWSEENEQLQTQGTTATSSGTGIKTITQKYFSFPTLSGAGTISVVYGTNKSTLKIYESTSTNIYGLDPIITLTSSSPTSSTYTFSSDKKYYMTMESSKVYFKKITFTPSSGAAVTPTLTWDDGDADIATTGVAKNTSNDDFIYTASQDKNSLRCYHVQQ